ncbi:MAG: ABC transporter substrate-binding protein [Planctomycetes bacterium]|nr:ABC transporter substrate-binding protein [Planctomycetota bacterium]
MNRVLLGCLGVASLAVLAAMVAAAPPVTGAPDEQPGGTPFFDARQRETRYAGPGRDVPEPSDVDEVLIGYFGPDDAAHPEGGDMWCGAQMAVDEANARGGYRGKRFRLVAGWSADPWGAGASHLARLVYRDRVWAVVGGIDGASVHLAEQVVAKARLALVSPAATDRTANLANVPWMFSCAPGDHLLAPVLAADMASRLAGGPFVVVSTDDHDSQMLAVEWLKCLAARGLVPHSHFQHPQGSDDVGELVTRVVEARPRAVAVVAGAHASAHLVAALRGGGYGGLVFGGPSMGRRRFVDEAGPAAEGVVFPLLLAPGPAAARFAEAFRARFGRPADYAAAYTYDAVGLLVAAIGKAGLNRARIGDAVRDLSPWTGVTGTVTWDALGSNTRPAALGTICGGVAGPVTSPVCPCLRSGSGSGRP